MSPFINYVDKQEGGGSQMSTMLHNLCSKLAYEERGGVKKPQNSVNVVYEWPL